MTSIPVTRLCPARGIHWADDFCCVRLRLRFLRPETCMQSSARNHLVANETGPGLLIVQTCHVSL